MSQSVTCQSVARSPRRENTQSVTEGCQVESDKTAPTWHPVRCCWCNHGARGLARPAPAVGSPENFSLATFDVTHMYVCRSASSSRSWCFQRKLRGKSFQESHRRARAQPKVVYSLLPVHCSYRKRRFQTRARILQTPTCHSNHGARLGPARPRLPSALLKTFPSQLLK